jgi:iron complex transport system ATP-binding protein
MAVLDKVAVGCTGLSCGYRDRPVLSDVNFECPTGSVTVLLGPNGSGKSTLLRTITGELPALAGAARLLGDDLNSLSVRDVARRVALVPQEEKQQFEFSVAELVTMGRLPYADSVFDTEDDRRAADEAIRSVKCEDLRDRSVLQLSGGELQRVLVARAFAQQPKILLMDEPTSHLDVQHALELVELLRGFARAGGTVVAAIHDLNLASLLGDQAILIGGGKATAPGPVHDILSSPKLDETFAVSFRRIESDGRLILVPSLDR